MLFEYTRGGRVVEVKGWEVQGPERGLGNGRGWGSRGGGLTISANFRLR